MATISITVPDTAVPRIKNAVAAITGVPAPATNAQVSALVRTYLRGLCLQVEGQQLRAAADTTASDVVSAEFPAE